jgi:uncharacterized protein YcfL
VRLRNKDSIAVQYRFEFYDGTGRLLTKSESWRYMQLEPKLQYRFTGTGTDPDVSDWRLIVRSAR